MVSPARSRRCRWTGAADPAPTRIVSPDGRPWSGDQPRGLDYWVRLHAIYQTEIVDERDRF
jgi:hypothetical protein